MERWARRYGDAVQFLCVCVESHRVAVAFTQMFELRAAVNAYIPGRSYMPVGYGQSGCSGFIIADAAGCFVRSKTKAFLQYGEDAFTDVETILATTLQIRPPSLTANPSTDGILHPEYPYKQGSRMVLTGIHNHPQLNTVVTLLAFDRTSGRFHVQLENEVGRFLAVLPCSLAPYRGDEASDTLQSIECPPSVGISSMDHEHDLCTKVLNDLLKEPSVETLKRALGVIEAHFTHEEDLMQRHGFGGDPASSFSALFSHIQYHQRILDLGRPFLSSAAAGGVSC